MRGVPSPWFGVDPRARGGVQRREHRHLPLLARDDRRAQEPSHEGCHGGYLVPFLCGFVYVYLTWYSFSDPRILEAFSTGQPDLAALSRGFSYEWCMAVGWAHFIAMDLFVGRWIYLDSQKNDVFAAHSLLLTLFFGPTGAISHVTTRAITGVVRGVRLDDVMAGALDAERDA